VDGSGGIRIEHNYHITPAGFERLSRHEITLT
jgi:Xaa-Pro aminopeptidase